MTFNTLINLKVNVKSDLNYGSKSKGNVVNKSIINHVFK